MYGVYVKSKYSDIKILALVITNKMQTPFNKNMEVVNTCLYNVVRMRNQIAGRNGKKALNMPSAGKVRQILYLIK